MADKKKRNKKYKPQPTALPAILNVRMASDENPMLATTLHTAVITLIKRPDVDAGNHLSKHLSYIAGGMSYATPKRGKTILQRGDVFSHAIRAAIGAIESMIDRHTRTGELFLDEAESFSMMYAAGKLDEALRGIPLACYERAVAEVDRVQAVQDLQAAL